MGQIFEVSSFWGNGYFGEYIFIDKIVSFVQHFSALLFFKDKIFKERVKKCQAEHYSKAEVFHPVYCICVVGLVWKNWKLSSSPVSFPACPPGNR